MTDARSAFRTLIPFLLASVVFFLTGCSWNDDVRPTRNADVVIDAERNNAVAAMVPAPFREKGAIRVGTDPSYPPTEFLDANGKLVGMEIDLMRAVGQVMGMGVEFDTGKFAKLFADVAAGRYDMAVASRTDTKAREKQVDMVSFAEAGTSLFARADVPARRFHGLTDLCGASVAVQRETTQETRVAAEDVKCRAAGLPSISIAPQETQDLMVNAVLNRQAQIGLTDTPLTIYLVDRSNHRLKILGAEYGRAPLGIAVRKGTGMAKPVLAALESLMRTGEYYGILAKWNLDGMTIDKPGINAAKD
ncbi:MAG TPA: ABC transporter substrate-binding protein [Solirubrobacterales bacterium]|jgi:polar amino acid transport system substrate-binding protein|nr:ABC transporter substrate-binding protein [Solirubrobacterales bacterium]